MRHELPAVTEVLLICTGPSVKDAETGEPRRISEFRRMIKWITFLYPKPDRAEPTVATLNFRAQIATIRYHSDSGTPGPQLAAVSSGHSVNSALLLTMIPSRIAAARFAS